MSPEEPEEEVLDYDVEEDQWPPLSDRFLTEWAPGVLHAQNAWMSSIDSLRAPDRKTHELIRMVCTVVARQHGGVQRHARLAAQVGATWDEIAGSILLTEPAFGIVLAMQALPFARRGFNQGSAEVHEVDDEDIAARLMQLAPDESVQSFRREFEAWLDEHLPTPEEMASEQRRSSSHIPEWGRIFQRAMFEAGYLVPGWPPELGGRNATPQEQMAYFEVVAARMVPRGLNPQGLSICAASIVEYGTDAQKERFVLPDPAGRDHLVSRDERTQRRQRSGFTDHPGRAQGRPLRRERPEGVDFRRARRGLLPLLRADRHGGAEAPRHQRAHHRHADAGHHLPSSS